MHKRTLKILQDVLINKSEANDFIEDALILIYSYVRRRSQKHELDSQDFQNILVMCSSILHVGPLILTFSLRFASVFGKFKFTNFVHGKT